MEEFLEVLGYSIPLFLVLVAGIFGMYFYSKEKKRSALEKQRLSNSSSMIKIRLQAYERLVLYLERISPQQIATRNQNQGISAIELQHTIVNNIRDEYEHNLVQQIYVSEEAWAQINQARLWVLKLVNESAEGLEKSASSNDLAIKIVRGEMSSGNNFVLQAKKALKSEVRELF